MPVLKTEDLNYTLKDAIDQIRFGGLGMNEGIDAMTTRRDAFASDLEMWLAGAAMVPRARKLLNQKMTERWEDFVLPEVSDFRNAEVVIGAGFHAAVYCATRVQMGFPKPIVLDSADAAHIGGAFAASTTPSFYLNSGNRPGLMGLPGNLESSLNYLPGAPIQPAMVSAGEYQTNADMALVIRLTLAQYAVVYPNVTVTNVTTEYDFDGNLVTRVARKDGAVFRAGRVIDARGCGAPSDIAFGELSTGQRILTFPQFARRMGEDPFPLRGLNRVAVIGGGDSGKCAIESLLGIGPSAHNSVAALDFVKIIDWFSTDLPGTCERWRDSQRGRYQAIGKYLPRDDRSGQRRLTIRDERAIPQPGLDSVLVGPDSYDLTILCTGNFLYPIESGYGTVQNMDTYTGGNFQGITLCRRERELYVVGPAAQLPFDSIERQRGVDVVAANSVAMFRLAPRTSTLAATLPKVSEAQPDSVTVVTDDENGDDPF
jgi:hypothetical protein